MKRLLTEEDLMGPGVLIGREGEIVVALRDRLVACREELEREKEHSAIVDEWNRHLKSRLASHAERDDVPRCPKCGYSRKDCEIHMDHHLCGEPTPPAPSPAGPDALADDVIAAAVHLAPLLEAGWDEYDLDEDQRIGSQACDELVKAVKAMLASGRFRPEDRDAERKDGQRRLVYNKATKRIDIVRPDGLVTDSFDPPVECDAAMSQQEGK